MRQVAEEALAAADLVVFIEEITAILDNNADDAGLSYRVYTYIFGNSDADVDDVMSKVHISNQQKNNTMSILQQLYQKGEIRGISLGEARGEARGIALTTKIIKLHTRGVVAEVIAEQLAIDVQTVHNAIAQFEAE